MYFKLFQVGTCPASDFYYYLTTTSRLIDDLLARSNSVSNLQLLNYSGELLRGSSMRFELGYLAVPQIITQKSSVTRPYD